MADDLQRSLKLNIEQRGAEKTAKEIQAIADAYEGIKNESESGSKSAQKLAEAQEKLARSNALSQLAQDAAKGAIETSQLASELDRLGATDSEISRIVSEMNRLTSKEQEAKAAASLLQEELEETARTTITLADRLEAFDAQNSLTRQRVGGLGDIDTGAQTIAGGLRTVGAGGAADALSGAGEIFAVAEGAAQLKAASKDLPAQLAAAAQAIGAPGIGLGAAMLATVAVVALLKRGFDEAKEAADRQTQAVMDYNEIVATQTSAQITEARANAETQRQIAFDNMQAFGELREEFYLMNSEGSTLDDNLTQMAADLGLANAELASIDEKYQESISTYQDAAAEIATYDRALSSSEVAARDAAEAEARLAEERAAAADAAASVFQRTMAFLNDENTDSAAVDERIASIAEEREVIEEIITTYNLSGQALATYQSQLVDLANEETLLVTRGREVVALRAAEAEQLANTAASQQLLLDAITDNVQNEIEQAQYLETVTVESANNRVRALETVNDAIERQLPLLEDLAEYNEEAAAQLATYRTTLYENNQELAFINSQALPIAEAREQFEGMVGAAQDAARAVVERANAIAKAEADIQAIREASASKISDLYNKLNDTLAKAATALNQKLTEAATQRNDKIIEAERDASRERVEASRERSKALIDLERDIAAQRSDILKRASQRTNAAIAARDALSAAQAQTDRKQELEELEEDGRERKREIRQQYREQLREIKDNLSEQRREINKAYASQVQAAQNTYRQTVQQANATTYALVQEERSRGAQQVAERRNALNQELTELQRFNRDGLREVNDFAINAVQLLRDMNTTAGAINNTASRSLQTPAMAPVSYSAGTNSTTVNSSTTVQAGSTLTQGDWNRITQTAAQAARTEVGNSIQQYNRSRLRR